MRTSQPAIARRLIALDEAAMQRAVRSRRAWLTRLLVPYTIAGTIGLPWILAGAAVDQTLRVTAPAVAAALAVGVLKVRCRRARPQLIPVLVRPQRTTSFPSGHAAAASAAACALTAVAPLLAVVWIGMAVVMAASRVYVGVHWLTDVAAGAGLGVLVVALPMLAVAVF
ncbi:MAG: phosphatase PAP2 family protein [Gaiellales bacterium]